MKPCPHTEFKVDCGVCWNARYSTAYRRVWGIDGPAEVPPGPFVPTQGGVVLPPTRDPVGSPCLHLGDDTGGRVLCVTCQGEVRLKLLVCTVYGRCTVKKAVDGFPCCMTCPDYRLREGGV